jgi:hypothetical protein
MTVFSNTVFKGTVYKTDSGGLFGKRKRRVASYRWTDLLREDGKLLEKAEALQEAQAIPREAIEIVNKYAVSLGPFPVIDGVRFKKALKDFAAFRRLIMRAPMPDDVADVEAGEFDELFHIMQFFD